MLNRDVNSVIATFKDVRAVSDAKIILDGLTVLCGQNSTGKTTISRTIQDLIESLLYLKVQIRDSLLDDLYHDIKRPIRYILSSINVDADKESYLEPPNVHMMDLSKEVSLHHIEGLLNLLRSVYASHEWKELQLNVPFTDFIRHISMPEPAIKSYTELEDRIEKRVINAKDDLEAVEKIRLSKEAFSSQAHLSSRYLWDGHVGIEESGNNIVSYSNDNVESASQINSISNTIYIESPLVSELKFNRDGSFNIANNLVPVRSNPKANMISSDVITQFINEVLHGEVKPDKAITGRKMWAYERIDGDDVESFDLEDCATGIKGVSIIANLYNQGCLTDKTLLIIDEPEAHLHPEWVIAYARIIILLIKRIGLRVLLASHSPDMINALQAFSISGNISKWTHFYQATPSKRVKSKFKYEFVDKNISVSDIFDSFNKVYDLINKYAATFRAEG